MRSQATQLDRPPPVGAWLQLLAALLWLPQAALLAWSIQQLSVGASAPTVLAPAIAVMLIGVLRAACEAWGMRQLFRDAREQVSRLRATVASALASHSPFDRHRPTSGLATSAITEQAELILPALTRYPPVRLRLRVVPVVLLATVAWQSWIAAAILLMAAPLIPLFMAVIGWRARAASEAQLLELGRLNGFLLDRLRGLATLRAFDAVDLTARRLRASAEDLKRRTMVVLRIAFLSSAVLELFSALGVALVAVYVGFHLLGQLPFGAWGQKLTLGEGLFILMLAPAFFEPLRDLAAVWHDRAAGTAALARLDALANPAATMVGMGIPEAQTRPEKAEADLRTAERTDDELPVPVQGQEQEQEQRQAQAQAVTVSGLSFGFDDETAVFDRFDLSVRPGEHLAIVGPSGSGKSTLLGLIAGMATPRAGEILIGALAMADDTARTARVRIGWMGQRPHVFAAPLRANVTMGRPVDSATIDAALRLAVLDTVDQVRRNAPLGEDGSGLSGGELVRLALARLATRRDIGVLLVDEPTAHLDGDTARLVIDALLDLARGRTLIVATHDPAVIERMDRTITLPLPGGQRRDNAVQRTDAHGQAGDQRRAA